MFAIVCTDFATVQEMHPTEADALSAATAGDYDADTTAIVWVPSGIAAGLSVGDYCNPDGWHGLPMGIFDVVRVDDDGEKLLATFQQVLPAYAYAAALRNDAPPHSSATYTVIHLNA